MNTNANRAIGAILSQLRAGSDITQVQLADKLGVPQSRISKMESGERSLQAYEIFDYSKALGITTTEFVEALRKGLSKR